MLEDIDIIFGKRRLIREEDGDNEEEFPPPEKRKRKDDDEDFKPPKKRTKTEVNYALIKFLKCSECGECNFTRGGIPMLKLPHSEENAWLHELKFICHGCSIDAQLSS